MTRTILLVDDDPEVRKAFARVLVTAGFEVVVAHGIANALDHAEALKLLGETFALVSDYDLGDQFGDGEDLIWDMWMAGGVEPRILISSDPPDDCRGADAIFNKNDLADDISPLIAVLEGV